MQRTELSIPESLRSVLQWATDRLRALYGARLQHLILYGSHARGDARPDSDVDLLVVLDGPVEPLTEARRTSRVALRAAAYRDTALSVVHLSAADFEDERRPLVRSARKEGIDLLETPLAASKASSEESIRSS